MLLIACRFTNQLTANDSKMDELIILETGETVSFDNGDFIVQFNGATREWSDKGDSYYADFTIN